MCVPDDVYVSVLGSQVERRRPIGVGGVSFFGLQQSSTHVTGQQQLDHLHTHTHTHTHTLDHFCRSSSGADVSELRLKSASYPDSAELTGQVQRGFPCVIHNTRVGLVLQQHL